MAAALLREARLKRGLLGSNGIDFLGSHNFIIEWRGVSTIDCILLWAELEQCGSVVLPSTDSIPLSFTIYSKATSVGQIQVNNISGGNGQHHNIVI